MSMNLINLFAGLQKIDSLRRKHVVLKEDRSEKLRGRGVQEK